MKFKVGPIFVYCEWNAADAAVVAALSLNQTADWAEGAKMGSRRQTSTMLTTGDMVGRTGDAARVSHSGYAPGRVDIG